MARKRRMAKVPLYGSPNKAALVEEGATAGATIGVDLFFDDGRVVTLEELAAAIGASAGGEPATQNNLSVTLWRLIREIPANVVEVAALSGAGIVVRQSDGNWLTRAIEVASTDRLTIANGDGGAGDPTLDLAAVADSGSGTLLAITRDAYGRVTGTRTPSTDDLVEGATNLYFTNERAQDAVGGILADSASIDFTYDDSTPSVSATVIPGGVDHDALANFVADEHVAHSAVQIIAGAGLTGGGDITTSRTLAVGAGTGIEVTADAVGLDASTQAALALAATAVQPGDLAAVAFSGSASDITSGTLSDARLSSNVPLKNAANTFTGGNIVVSGGGVREFRLVITDASANEGVTALRADASSFSIVSRDDSFVLGSNLLRAMRDGTTWTSLDIAATAITLNGVNVADYARLSQNNTFSGNNTFSTATINTLAASGASIADLTVTDSITLPAASIADSALSNNVPLKNAPNTFTDTQIISASIPRWRAVSGAATAEFQATSGGGFIGTTTNHGFGIFTNNTTRIAVAADGSVTINGVNVADYARLSQPNALTAGADAGFHTYPVKISNPNPFFALDDSDAPADNRHWDFGVISEQLQFRVVADAGNDVRWLTVDRTGLTVDSIALSATTINFNGNVTVNGLEAATEESGSFTATLTGMTTTVQGTINWYRTGNRVTLVRQGGALVGTSNSTAMTMTGIPAAIQPADGRDCITRGVDNSSNVVMAGRLSGDTITFNRFNGTVFTTFTASGNKGLEDDWQFSYEL